MIYSLLISCLLVILYVGVTIWRHKQLPESISSLVYNLPKPWQWVWIVWMWAVTFTMAPAFIEAMPDNFRFLAFLTIACLLFVGAMPLVKNERNTFHNILGIAAGVFSQVCVAIMYLDWIAFWGFFLFLAGSSYIQPEGWMGRTVDGKNVLLSELCCFITVIGAILIILL